MTDKNYTPEQIAENRRLWVEALRSGKYRQGKGYLKALSGDQTAYCCLGVACEVLGLPSVHNEGVVYWHYLADGDSATSYLPYDVQSALGLNTEDPALPTPSGGYLSATTANDAALWDFDRIADALEEMFRHLDEVSG